jgi:hypothetical protein
LPESQVASSVVAMAQKTPLAFLPKAAKQRGKQLGKIACYL